MINKNVKSDTYKHDIRWINYIRAIAIIAIYYIHAQEFFEYSVKGLSKYILPFYVNSFFFVSGYLLFRKHMYSEKNCINRESTRKKYLQNIIFRLIIPSIIFSIIEFFPSSYIQHNRITIISFVEKTIWGNTFWFLSALAVAELILYVFIYKDIRNMTVYCLIGVVLFTIGVLIGKNDVIISRVFTSNPWHVEKGLMAIIFLIGGGVYWRYESVIDRYIFKPVVFILSIVVYISTIYFLNQKIKVLISMNNINFAGVILSFLSIIVLIVICKSIKLENKVTYQLDKIGRHTIGFYFVCGAIPKVLVLLLSKIMHSGTILYMILGFSLSFILAYIIVFCMEKYLPFLFDIRKCFVRKTR